MIFPVRINKYLADMKLASRREADTLIAEGKVLVNGKPAVIGQKVTATDKVTLKGERAKKTYLAYYKPRGVITHSPATGETDIAMKLMQDYKISGVSPIGRLDKDSEGLILLCNDGRVTGPLLDPEAHHEKVYDVLLDKEISNHFLRHMETGVNIEGYLTRPATVVKKNAKRFHITLTEGKKHQIRRMCAALGYQVQALKRIRIEHIELGKLTPNQYRKLTTEEIATLLSSLGLK